MKKTLALILSACVLLATLTSCNFGFHVDAYPVENLTATAYEGAIVITFDYDGDGNNGAVLCRKSDAKDAKEPLKKIYEWDSLDFGEYYYVDRLSFESSLENDKEYTYVLTTKANPIMGGKSVEQSVKAKAIVTKANTKLENWKADDVKTELRKIDDDYYICVTRPDSYVFQYYAYVSATYEWKYSVRKTDEKGIPVLDDNGSPVYVTKTDTADVMLVPIKSGANSTKKGGVDGTAQDLYKLEKAPKGNYKKANFTLHKAFSFNEPIYYGAPDKGTEVTPLDISGHSELAAEGEE